MKLHLKCKSKCARMEQELPLVAMAWHYVQQELKAFGLFCLKPFPPFLSLFSSQWFQRQMCGQLGDPYCNS